MFDRNRCLNCKYSSFHNELTCDYILIEGHMRGCYEGTCTKFEKRTTKRKLHILFGEGEKLNEEYL